MDTIGRNNSLNNVEGIVISALNYLNKGYIYKIITQEHGYIDVFSKNIKSKLVPFSKYSLRLKEGRNMYSCVEFDIMRYNNYRNKNIIISLNFIAEILTKSMLPNIDTAELFKALEFILDRLTGNNNIELLFYFVIFYLKFHGYYFYSNNFIGDKKYTLDIREFDIKEYYPNHDLKQYEFQITGSELNFISECILNENIDLNDFPKNFNYRRLFGIFTNSICINLEIRELNSFKFIL